MLKKHESDVDEFIEIPWILLLTANIVIKLITKISQEICVQIFKPFVSFLNILISFADIDIKAMKF